MAFVISTNDTIIDLMEYVHHKLNISQFNIGKSFIDNLYVSHTNIMH